MAPDLAVRPVTYRPERYLCFILGQTKTILNCPAIQACLDYFIGCPVGYIGNKDVLAESIVITGLLSGQKQRDFFRHFQRDKNQPVCL